MPSIIPDRIEANQDNTEQGLAKMVLTLIEIIRKLLERQAIRRVEGGTLSEQEIERLGLTLMKLENKMDELKQHFQLTDDDLTIDLGPIGELM
ncbi:gas vesicle protein K [bacterium]|nr:gas vesicle protein K [bacterium]